MNQMHQQKTSIDGIRCRASTGGTRGKTYREIRRMSMRSALSMVMLSTLMACSLSDIVGEPTTREDNGIPDAAKSEPGALAFYQGVVHAQALALSEYTMVSGILSDELGSIRGFDIAVDARRLPEGPSRASIRNGSFTQLQSVRTAAQQGRGLLAQYAPAQSPALRGHLYAIEGMANVMLAELYCSGIPLGTVTYNGGATSSAGLLSSQIYEIAEALFDSAIAITADSARIADFARIGKGRALINLGRFDEARSIVSTVPTEFQYLVRYGTAQSLRNGFYRPTATSGYPMLLSPSEVTTSIQSTEGSTGLPYATSGDWRTDTALVNIMQPAEAAFRVRVARKYAATGATSIILASGVEARLIEAESYQRKDDAMWLTILNSLRETCVPGSACSPVLVATGAVSPLPAIVDPIDPAARIDTLFKERAAWLYLTGHRQGDMRRLIRQYARPQNTVYPTGIYPGGELEYAQYGTDVTLPPPEGERQNNPNYTGCVSRGA